MSFGLGNSASNITVERPLAPLAFTLGFSWPQFGDVHEYSFFHIEDAANEITFCCFCTPSCRLHHYIWRIHLPHHTPIQGAVLIIAKENGDLLNQESYRLLRATYPDLNEPLLEFDKFQPWRADKKEILIQQGDPTSIVRFMISGLARLFFVDDEGNEQTKFFLGSGYFLVPMHSLFLEKNSWFSIQASTPCRGVAINAKTFKRLLRTDRQWANYWICYMTQLFIAKENRERDLLTMSGREKYLDLLANFPEIARHVPLHQIASYLGITDVTLSRIRKGL